MAAFPNIRESDWELFKQSTIKKQEKTPMESGKVQSRVAHTLSKKMFTIGWKWLTFADYTLLETFFVENIGTTFPWTHIHTDVSYTVRFADDVFPEVTFLGADFVLGPEALKLEEA